METEVDINFHLSLYKEFVAYSEISNNLKEIINKRNLIYSELAKSTSKYNLVSELSNDNKEELLFKALILNITVLKYSLKLRKINVNYNSIIADYPKIISKLVSLDLYELNYCELLIYLNFFINSFRLLDNSEVSMSLLKYFSITNWINLSPKNLKKQLISDTSLIEKWKILLKMSEKEDMSKSPYCLFLNNLLNYYLCLITNNDINRRLEISNLIKLKDFSLNEKTNIINKILELCVDISSEPKINKYVSPLIKEKHIIEVSQIILEKNKKIKIQLQSKSNILEHLVEKLSWFIFFSDNNNTDRFKKEYYEKINIIQGLAYNIINNKQNNDTNNSNSSVLLIKNIVSLDNYNNITQFLDTLSNNDLYEVASKVNFLTYNKEFYFNNDSKNSNVSENSGLFGRALIYQIFFSNLLIKQDVIQGIINTPLLPNEKTLFNYYSPNNLFHFNLEHESPLAKYNRFINIDDFLIRSYFSLGYEMIFNIQKLIVSEITSVKACFRSDNNELSYFKGQFNNSLPIKNFKLEYIKPSLIGESLPSIVIGEINFSYSLVSDLSSPYINKDNIDNIESLDSLFSHNDIISQQKQKSWDRLTSGDVLFLVSFKKQEINNSNEDLLKSSESISEVNELQIDKIRSCYVSSIVDVGAGGLEDINFSDRFHQDKIAKSVSKDRKMFVYLDPKMYNEDLIYDEDFEDIYSNFQLIIKLNDYNNYEMFDFKTIKEQIHSLESIQHMLKSKTIPYLLSENSCFNEIKKIILDEKISSKENTVDLNNNKNEVTNNSEIKKLLDSYNIRSDKQLKKMQKQYINYVKEKKTKSYNQEVNKNLCKEEYIEQIFSYLIQILNSTNISKQEDKNNKLHYTNNEITEFLSLSSLFLNKISHIDSNNSENTLEIIISIIKNLRNDKKTLIVSKNEKTLNELAEALTILKVIPEKNILTIFNKDDYFSLNDNVNNPVTSINKTPYLSYHNDVNKINHFLNKRALLINSVLQIMNTTKLTQTININCCDAITYLEVKIIPLLNEFKNALNLINIDNNKTNNDQDTSLIEQFKIQLDLINLFFPEKADLISKVLNDLERETNSATNKSKAKGKHSNKFDNKEVIEVLHIIDNLKDIILNYTQELEEIKIFELIRDNKERSKYIVSNLSRVILMTTDQVANLLDTTYNKVVSTSHNKSTESILKRYEFYYNYNNIIYLESNLMTEIDLILPLSFLNKNDESMLPGKHSCYNNINLDHIILFGDYYNDLNISNRELNSLVGLNKSLFLKIKDKENKLSINYISIEDDRLTHDNEFCLIKEENINQLSYISSDITKASIILMFESHIKTIIKDRNKLLSNDEKENRTNELIYTKQAKNENKEFGCDIQFFKYTHNILSNNENHSLELCKYLDELNPHSNLSLLKSNNSNNLKNYLIRLKIESELISYLVAYMVMRNYKVTDIYVIVSDSNKTQLIKTVLNNLSMVSPSLKRKLTTINEDDKDNYMNLSINFPNIVDIDNIERIPNIKYSIYDAYCDPYLSNKEDIHDYYLKALYSLLKRTTNQVVILSSSTSINESILNINKNSQDLLLKLKSNENTLLEIKKEDELFNIIKSIIGINN